MSETTTQDHGGVSETLMTTFCFAHARVEALPFRDGQFDAAYCGGALHGFPDTVGSLREIGRTLKPGAPLVVLTFLDRDQPFVRLRRRAEARNEKLLKLHMFEVPELQQALARAGFEGFEPLIYGGVIILRARKRHCAPRGKGGVSYGHADRSIVRGRDRAGRYAHACLPLPLPHHH